MTKKLLIAGGCSNTDQNYIGYTKEGVFTWPQVIADEMGWDLLNVGKAGHGNDTIEDCVFDALVQNQDREIVLMVLWSEPCRLNIFDIDSIRITSNLDLIAECFGNQDWFKIDKDRFIESLTNYSDSTLNDFLKNKDYIISGNKQHSYDRNIKLEFIMQHIIKMWLSDHGNANAMKVDKKIINKSLRSFEKVYALAKGMKNVKQYHECGLSLTFNLPWMFPFWKHEKLNYQQKKYMTMRIEHIVEYIKDHPTIKKLDIKWWDKGLVNYLDESRLLPCRHYNQKGQDFVANTFMMKYDND